MCGVSSVELATQDGSEHGTASFGCVYEEVTDAAVCLILYMILLSKCTTRFHHTDWDQFIASAFALADSPTDRYNSR